VEIAIFPKMGGFSPEKLNFSEIPGFSGYFSRNCTFRPNGTSGHLKRLYNNCPFRMGAQKSHFSGNSGISVKISPFS